ncbi:hypothetical protein JOD51_000030 [Curtobacterium herbarum]|nr:hypothetical protein [Curtobacterium herbarum]
MDTTGILAIAIAIGSSDAARFVDRNEVTGRALESRGR